MPDQRDWASILLKHGYAGLKKIGEGSFGVAVLVQDQEGHKAVCKLVDVSRATPKECQEARREGRLLAQLKHPYIVRYRENFADRGWLGIIMDFCDGGDLTAQIKAAASRQDAFDEDRILQWFTQCMLALKYLHSKHVLHRDLKPSNIFLNSAGHVRLGDFGISKVMNCTTAYAKTFVGTPYYLSPEVITEKPYAWPADIWSMGCILFQLCALKVPFDATNIANLAQKICNGRIPSIPQPYSAALRQLCLEMMTKKASARPSCDDVINTPLIQEAVRVLLAEVQRPQQPKAKHEIMDQFHKFDQNADGVIDRRELSMVLKHLDAEVWTDENIDELLHVVDRNKDGRIQFDEFLLWAFGCDKQLSLAARAEETMQSARGAAGDGDIEQLCQILVDWRQAVDVGCLRVSPSEVSVKACKAIEWITSACRRSLEEHQDPSMSYKLVRQLRAILLAVEQLLDECARRRVQRIAGIASRGALRGCCLEVSGGVRQGQCLGGLSDNSMESMGARWERLAEGERILAVKGFAAAAASRASQRRPSPEPLPRRGSRRGSSRASSPQPDEGKLEEPLSACVTFCTSHGRELEFGAKTGRGDAFSFEAPEGEEIEAVRFADRTCVEVKSAPIPVCWSKDKIDEVRQSFQLAAGAVWSTLLRLSFRVGPQQGKFALLEARRLGVTDLAAVPPEVEDPYVGWCQSLKPPSHWDLKGAGESSELGPDAEVVQVQLGEEELAKLQGVLTASFAQPPTSPADDVDRLTPQGVELVRASRLQNWQAWVRFSARREEVRAQLATLHTEAAALSEVPAAAEPAAEAEGELVSMGESVAAADAKAADEGQLLKSAHVEELLGVQLDSDTRGAWLFHGVTAQAAQGIARPDFDIAQAGPENGRLYGRGCYFSEWADQTDRLCTWDQSVDGLRCMLLCRVTLGRALVEAAVLPDVLHLLEQCTSGPYHSVLGQRGHSAEQPRDFVVYDKDQVYPEFLLWYRRVYR